MLRLCMQWELTIQKQILMQFMVIGEEDMKSLSTQEWRRNRKMHSKDCDKMMMWRIFQCWTPKK